MTRIISFKMLFFVRVMYVLVKYIRYMHLFSSKCKSDDRLDGKYVIVTGCNSGIGKETVSEFYKRGANVILACRNLTKANKAKEDIEKSTNLSKCGVLIVKKLNLASLESVRNFAKQIIKEGWQINILVNNAGIGCTTKGTTEDGFETIFGTNHLGHFSLTLLLLPNIIQSAPARIVTVSSFLHARSMNLADPNFEQRPFNTLAAYNQSKLANILFSAELSRILKENGIENVTTYSVHPGIVFTDIFKNLDSMFFPGCDWLFKNLIGIFLRTPKQGAQTTVYCAVDSKCSKESGLFYQDCAAIETSEQATDKELAKKLWNLSLELVKMKEYDPFL